MRTPSKKFLCFGDSITENGGWISHLNERVPGEFYNGGKSGRKALQAPQQFPEILATYPQANHLILFLGINDLPSRDPRPGTERIGEAIEALATCIDQALPQIQPENIILVSPCGIDPQGMSETNLTKGYQDALPLLEPYAKALEALADEKETRFLNLLGQFEGQDFRDGLHLNERGEKRLAQILAGYLQRPSLYWVGDSISIDYHRHLKEALCGDFHYARKSGLAAAYQNLDQAQGANGGDSSMVLAHLRELIARGRLWAETVVFNCGLHDIKCDPKTEKRQIPPESYRTNLEAIIGELKKAKKAILWVTTTPLDEEIHRQRIAHFHRKEQDLKTYQNIATGVMRQNEIPVIDLHAFTLSLTQNLFRDHVHFTPEVCQKQALFLADQVRKIN